MRAVSALVIRRGLISAKGRTGYWLTGASIAFSGAIGARVMAEYLPLSQRIPVWFVGGAIILLGLCVLCLGSRIPEQAGTSNGKAAQGRKERGATHPEIGAGAGEGDRTLV